MKKLFITIICTIISLTSFADNSTNIISKVVSNYKAQKGIFANYSIATNQGNSKGSIIMEGNKFRMQSNDLICWYDGKTQWSYSPMTEEVNISEPTNEELQMVNPYAIVSNFQNAFNSKQLKSPTAGNHVVRLTPKKSNSSEIANITITISQKTYLPNKIVFELKDKTQLIIIVSNYKCKQNFANSQFTFDRSLVPEGTPIIDLR